nr:immunoglobulin heavy chain junction region [Mus musculus]MBK4187640.1 immunoglobulin heavy chain junction region [Mus musculus]MBK4187641.1 immunoglobulin heavy chain junction region [Mus musculus]MBK4187642.1 immunoglobulin heavy chain junction region [Mus musculus]MBK4187647.1 immunoglobulin heavy chain junction region [Mus musculus]
CARAYPFDYW